MLSVVVNRASQVTTLWRYTTAFVVIIIINFLTRVFNSQGVKKYAMQYRKVQKNKLE